MNKIKQGETMDLVIMAAGLGTRFGGLKQLEPVDENGNFILDYSVFDAICAGFDRVLFIIKPEIFDQFKQTVGKRIEEKIKVQYVFQDFENLKTLGIVPKSRTKPLGTGHAVLCAKKFVNSPFAVLNADDFYGKESVKILADFLKTNKNENEFVLVAFNLFNTMSKFGSVKRGICFAENHYLKSIQEAEIFEENNSIFAIPLQQNNYDKFKIDANSLVSMNLFGFSPLVFDYLEKEFDKFLKTANLECDEFFLPTAIGNMVKENLASVKILQTPSKWQGLTHKNDLPEIKSHIKFLIKNKEYPKDLWN